MLLVAAVIFSAAEAAERWKPIPAPIRTQWYETINSDSCPLPEYPRPQLERNNWTNLNGIWEFALAKRDDPMPTRFRYRIMVPFPVESALSGVGKSITADQAMWYHRKCKLNDRKLTDRTILNFEAVDWQTNVWVNGKAVMEHKGGYDPFSCDITDAIGIDGDVDLVVKVWDPSENGNQPRGNQKGEKFEKPYGHQRREASQDIAVHMSGIWQTVWIEQVPSIYVTAIYAETIGDMGGILVEVVLNQEKPVALSVMLQNGEKIIHATGTTARPLVIKIPEAKLWTPDNPALYQMSISVEGGDEIYSYVGIRRVEVRKDKKGVNRIFLNGQAIFNHGVLDRGWWPESLGTPPSDNAFIYDLEAAKKFGFNTVRKNAKVEARRWYWHCDRLGLMVWQDMPHGDSATKEGYALFEDEAHRHVANLKVYPSIVMWILHDREWLDNGVIDDRLKNDVKILDPTRLVSCASGIQVEDGGDIIDTHGQPDPVMQKHDPRRASVMGLYGNPGIAPPDLVNFKIFRPGSDFHSAFAPRPQPLAVSSEKTLQMMSSLVLLNHYGLSGAIFSSLADSENNHDGLMTFNRKIERCDAEKLSSSAKPLWGLPLEVKTIIPTAQERAGEWRYSIEKPADEWARAEFDDGKWATGLNGFGYGAHLGNIRTKWNAREIWLRRDFIWEGGELSAPWFLSFNTAIGEIYINGEHASTMTDRSLNYVCRPALLGIKLKKGRNVIAVHGHQTFDRQYLDVGLVDVVIPKGDPGK